ncbi:ATP-dependent RNA helicase glh-2-like [Onychostruthus taczanowskii]|uniref:ATP-dependent RNA helicase glh-2-like n=1 Tax=Onychostruthus taczanowskii TaxID=356909 RepID=UPI001B802FF2|nr:ATP-dependent RNA helicase glh-2-like [Onychostruthus taczanowskii]
MQQADPIEGSPSEAPSPIAGLLVAVPPQEPLGPRFQRDPEIPNVFHAQGFGAGGFQNGSGGSHLGSLGSLFQEGPQFGEGSQCQEGLRGLGQGSCFGSGGSQFVSGGSQFGEGSQAQGCPHLESGGSQFREGSQAQGCPHLESGGSEIEPGLRDLSLGSPIESGVPKGLGEPELGLGSPNPPELGLGSSNPPELGLGSSNPPELGLGSSNPPELGLGSPNLPELGLVSLLGVPDRQSDPELGLGSPFGSGVLDPPELGLGSPSPPELGLGSPGPPELGLGSSSGPELGLGSRLLVLALQGKSPRPQLWALRELEASNGQLRELSPRRCACAFVLPPGGRAAGLQGRAVLLHPLGSPGDPSPN